MVRVKEEINVVPRTRNRHSSTYGFRYGFRIFIAIRILAKGFHTMTTFALSSVVQQLQGDGALLCDMNASYYCSPGHLVLL